MVSDPSIEGRPWGMCAAYGCPLPGSTGHSAGDGKWYCCCHINMPASLNDAITMELNSPALDFIVQTVLDLRECNCSFYSRAKVWNRIGQRFRDDRPDLLMNDGDKANGGVRAWLMRLERALIDGTRVGSPQAQPKTVPTAPVIGPTHADTYHPYAQGE